MPTIGLTGGIATGKSTVGNLLRGCGATLFSADEVAHAIAAPGSSVVRRIAERFGGQFVLADGSLDRAALGALVFSNPDARRQLEEITHPAILEELRKRIDDAQRSEPGGLIVVETPLLFEAGMDDWFDAVLTVTASPEIQRRRLMERSGLSIEEADARIASQMPLDEKAARSQFVMQNDGDMAALEDGLQRLIPRLRAVDKRLQLTQE